jgi:hypothetical protein
MRKVKPQNMKDQMKKMDSQDIYPEIRLPLSSIPEAKKWEIGKTYQITLEVELTSIGGGGMMPSSGDGNAAFEVYGVEAGKEVKGKVERYQDDNNEGE